MEKTNCDQQKYENKSLAKSTKKHKSHQIKRVDGYIVCLLFGGNCLNNKDDKRINSKVEKELTLFTMELIEPKGTSIPIKKNHPTIKVISFTTRGSTIFLNYLNQNRAKLLLLDDLAFQNIKTVFQEIINGINERTIFFGKFLRSQDLELLQYVLMLSQTFYKKINADKKVLLSEAMENISLLEKIWVWKDLIKHHINSERKKKEVNQKLVIDQIQLNVISLLLSYNIQMTCFGINNETIESIINFFLKKYSIPFEHFSSLK